jgi:CBS domain containing-hemolysin-like protein
LFDQASNLLLKALRIEPVHDVEHAATPRDLEAIIDQSRDSGDLPPELSTLLDRVLDFTDATARAAMIPRPRVATVSAEETVAHLVELMGSGHSRYPVVQDSVDDIVGVVCLRDVLALPDRDLARMHIRDLARQALVVPDSLPLPVVLERLREEQDEFACVLDEYGGLAGVITLEDIAEELLGEITDEHDPQGIEEPRTADDGWTVPGSIHLQEVERLLDHDLPEGDYHTLSGLIIAELGRLPEPGDTVTLCLPPPAGAEDDEHRRLLKATVCAVDHRVPETGTSRADTPRQYQEISAGWRTCQTLAKIDEISPKSMRLYKADLSMGEVGKTAIVQLVSNSDRAGWAIPMLCQNEVRFAGSWVISLKCIGPV